MRLALAIDHLAEGIQRDAIGVVQELATNRGIVTLHVELYINIP